MYFHRELEEPFARAIKTFPVCLVTGPRQAGKSTFLQHALKDYTYITLDDPLHRKLAQDDPELFLSSYPPPLIIDEVQYAPNLLSYIKIRVDTHRRTYGQYVLTGSQTFQLMKGVSETLAGRIAIFQLYPLNWKEISKIKGHETSSQKDLSCAKQIVQGFYPEFFVSPHLDWSLWYGSYLSTYIERDVRNIKAISDLGRFQTFIGLLATRAGQLLNMSEIGKECGITQPTVKDWLSILESTYIISLLKPYHKNHSKRLVKSPKLYFVDTGLLCYLLGIDSAERFLKASERGHIFENMVVMEFLKTLAYQPQRSRCSFYRTAAGLEIDLLVEQGTSLDAYEIKLAKTLTLEMAQSLAEFCQTHNVHRAKLLSLQEQTIHLAKDVQASHWSSII